MFQVVRYTPIRSAIHDGYIGQSAERMPMVYCTLGWAVAVARREEGDDDEAHCRVIPAGGDVWRPLCPPFREPLLDECPF